MILFFGIVMIDGLLAKIIGLVMLGSLCFVSLLRVIIIMGLLLSMGILALSLRRSTRGLMSRELTFFTLAGFSNIFLESLCIREKFPLHHLHIFPS